MKSCLTTNSVNKSLPKINLVNQHNHFGNNFSTVYKADQANSTSG